MENDALSLNLLEAGMWLFVVHGVGCLAFALCLQPALWEIAPQGGV